MLEWPRIIKWYLFKKILTYLHFSKERVRETNIVYSLLNINNFILSKESEMTYKAIQVCLGDNAGSVPDHCNKVNMAIK